MTNSIPTVSICTIVKNEEKQIASFLDSLCDFADEIVVVDTGSTDKTISVIENQTHKNEKIKFYKYYFDGVFHYGKAKNFSIEKATSDYVIILDADERLSDEFRNHLKSFLVQENPDVAKVKRVDDCLRHLVDYPERIIKTGRNIFYLTNEDGRVHETLKHEEKSYLFDFIVWHQQRENHYIQRPQRILFQLELQIERTPKTKSFLGHFLRGLWYFYYRFKKLYFQRGLYRDGSLGFKYAFMRSLDAFLIQLFVGLKPGDRKYWQKN